MSHAQDCFAANTEDGGQFGRGEELLIRQGQVRSYIERIASSISRKRMLDEFMRKYRLEDQDWRK